MEGYLIMRHLQRIKVIVYSNNSNMKRYLFHFGYSNTKQNSICAVFRKHLIRADKMISVKNRLHLALTTDSYYYKFKATVKN